tara:strand:+ start:1336 stop:1584 length:249 start_codon:yes stop_codon:yes gene_type:complete
MDEQVWANTTHYFINKRYEATMNKLTGIQEYLVSLVDRILKVVADMNLRLGYVMELCLRLTENPVHPKFEDSRTKTPTTKSD